MATLQSGWESHLCLLLWNKVAASLERLAAAGPRLLTQPDGLSLLAKLLLARPRMRTARVMLGFADYEHHG